MQEQHGTFRFMSEASQQDWRFFIPWRLFDLYKTLPYGIIGVTLGATRVTWSHVLPLHLLSFFLLSLFSHSFNYCILFHLFIHLPLHLSCLEITVIHIVVWDVCQTGSRHQIGDYETQRGDHHTRRHKWERWRICVLARVVWIRA